MKTVEYLNPALVPSEIEGESGKRYAFELAEDRGRLLASVDDDDANELVERTDRHGRPVFRFAIEEAKAVFDPARRNYEELDREQLRELYLSRAGRPAPGRMRNDTLIDELRGLDGEVKPEPEPRTDVLQGVSLEELAGDALAATEMFAEVVEPDPQPEPEASPEPEPVTAAPEGVVVADEVAG